DIVAAATRILTDEARHADYALRLASLYEGREASFSLERAAVNAHLPAALEIEDVDALMVEVAAISETLAAALIGACRDRARDPVPRALFTSILGDEVHHARIGWYYLTWRAPQWSMPERQRAADRAGALVAGVEKRFSRGRDAPPGSRKAARALGVLE